MSMADTWTTRDGRVIPIQNMEDSHLVSAIRYVRRRPVVRSYARLRAWQLASAAFGYAATAPDGAAMAAEEYASGLLEGELDSEFIDEVVAEVNPTFAMLVAEAKLRKLEY